MNGNEISTLLQALPYIRRHKGATFVIKCGGEIARLRLPDSKTGARTIHLSAPALAVLSSIERQDDNPYVIDTLGQIYLEGGRPDRAAKLFEKALAIAPETAEIRFHMAIAYAKTGRPDTARRHLKEVLRNVDGGSDLAAEAHAALQTLPD